MIAAFWEKTHPREPLQVVFVGHSMGGIVARSLYLNPNFDVSTVALHIELASPTRRPVVYLDRGLWEFYERVTGLWDQVGHVLPPVLSIMGGERDLQVNVISFRIPIFKAGHSLRMTSRAPSTEA